MVNFCVMQIRFKFLQFFLTNNLYLKKIQFRKHFFIKITKHLYYKNKLHFYLLIVDIRLANYISCDVFILCYHKNND